MSKSSTALSCSIIIALGLILAGICVRTAITRNAFGDNLGRLDKRSITVTTTSKVKGTPDIINFSITVSNISGTSSLALKSVTEKISLILNMVRAAGVKEEDIKTSRMSIYPKYNWKNGEESLIGQEAVESLEITMDIDDKKENFSKLIEDVSTIEGVSFSDVNFDIRNKEELYIQARKKVVEESINKITEYAKNMGANVLDISNLSEGSFEYSYPSPVAVGGMFRNSFKATSKMDSFTKESSKEANNASSTSFSVGQIELSATVTIRAEISNCTVIKNNYL